MTNQPLDDFVERERELLIGTVDRYLNKQIPHRTARDHAWSVIERWSQLSIDGELPATPGESALWATVWTIQHVADEEHWHDQVTQESLTPLLAALRDRTELPLGYESRRPQ